MDGKTGVTDYIDFYFSGGLTEAKQDFVTIYGCHRELTRETKPKHCESEIMLTGARQFALFMGVVSRVP